MHLIANFWLICFNVIVWLTVDILSFSVVEIYKEHDQIGLNGVDECNRILTDSTKIIGKLCQQSSIMNVSYKKVESTMDHDMIIIHP